MRKILMAVLLALLPALAGAQPASMFPQSFPFCGGTGCQFNAPILLPDGNLTNPAMSFASQPGIGFNLVGTTGVELVSLAGHRIYMSNATLRMGANLAFGWAVSNDAVGANIDTALWRDAANTLALRNGGTAGAAVPQTFNVYNFCDGAACATGYERGAFRFATNRLEISTEVGGTGTARNIYIGAAGGRLYVANGYFQPSNNEGADLGDGSGAISWKSVYQTRATMGYKQKTINDASATAFDRLALPQTLGTNMTTGVLLYHVHCDNGTMTTYADRSGEVAFSCNNIGGTEACVFDTTTAQTATQAATYALAVPTWTATGGTDTVDLNANVDCTGVVGPTNMYIRWRLNILTPQTETPQ